MRSLSVKWSGVRETLQEEGLFRLSFTNRSRADIDAMVLHYYLDGKAVGSRACQNADGSALGVNDAVVFEFAPEDFPEGTGAAGLSGFLFDLSVRGRDGSETPVSEGLRVSAKYAWTYYFTLSGSYAEGFILSEG